MEPRMDERVAMDAMKFELDIWSKRFKNLRRSKEHDLKDNHKRLKQQLRNNVCRKVKTITNHLKFLILSFLRTKTMYCFFPKFSVVQISLPSKHVWNIWVVICLLCYLLRKIMLRVIRKVILSWFFKRIPDVTCTLIIRNLVCQQELNWILVVFFK